MITATLLTQAGLVFNFVGTVMVAFAFGKNRGGAYQNGADGKREYLASLLYPKLFNWGMGLVGFGFGFLIQMLATFDCFK